MSGKKNLQVVIGVLAVFAVGGGILYAALSRPPAEAGGQAVQAGVEVSQAPAPPASVAGGQSATAPGGSAEAPRAEREARPEGGQRSGGSGGSSTIERAMAQLKLTPAQEEQAKAIQAKAATEVAAIQTGPGTDEEKREKRRAATREAREAFEKLLTAEQKQQFSTVVEASRDRGGRGGRTPLREVLGQLKLTADQQAKIDKATKEYDAAREKIRADSQVSPEEGQQMRAAFEKYQAAVQAVLTPEQEKQLADLRGRPGQGRGDGPRGGPGGPFGGPGGPGGPGGGPGRGRGGGFLQRVVAEMELSADQKQKIEEILGKQRADMDRARAEAGEGNFEGMREKSREIREKATADVMTVLTPEQREKAQQRLEQLREEMRQRGGSFGGPGGPGGPGGRRGGPGGPERL